VEAKNIALATHNASLLKRALEAEQRAERLERRNAQLVQELDRIREARPYPHHRGSARSLHCLAVTP
jgi:hypothetical protein